MLTKSKRASKQESKRERKQARKQAIRKQASKKASNKKRSDRHSNKYTIWKRMFLCEIWVYGKKMFEENLNFMKIFINLIFNMFFGIYYIIEREQSICEKKSTHTTRRIIRFLTINNLVPLFFFFFSAHNEWQKMREKWMTERETETLKKNPG